MFTNQPALNILSTATGPPLTVGTTTSAVGAGGWVGGTAVGGMGVGGGASVAACVGTTVTLTVYTITAGVAVGSGGATVGCTSCCITGAAHAVKATARKRIDIFSFLALLLFKAF